MGGAAQGLPGAGSPVTGVLRVLSHPCSGCGVCKLLERPLSRCSRDPELVLLRMATDLTPHLQVLLWERLPYSKLILVPDVA